MTTDLIAQAEAVREFLRGAGPLEDRWFGDDLPGPRFWWRKHLDVLPALIARIRELEGERDRAKALTELARLDAPLIAAEGVQGKIPRYDLEQPTSHMGSAAMQRDDYGDWVRYEDHAAAITVVSQGDYADLIAQLTRRADEMEAIDHSCSLQPAWVLEAITALEKAVKDNRRAASALTALEVKLAEVEKERDEQVADLHDVIAMNNRTAAQLEATVASLKEQVEAMRGALTPSADTKADYIGEFSFDYCTGFDPDGNEVVTRIAVPWTTIKEIMAAIRARAAITTENQTNG